MMENEKNTTKKKRGLITLIVIIAIIAGAATGMIIGKRIKAYRDYVAEQKFKAAQEEVVNEELEKILAMDPFVDEVDQTIYAEKEYAAIETAMKSYFTDFFSVAKSVNGFPTDERFTVLMNQEQMLADAPNFTNTLSAINTLKTEYISEADILSDMMTESKMNSYLDQNLEQEYVDIYDKMMTSGATVTAETKLQDDISTSKDQVVGILDKYKTLIDYLVSTQDGWQLEGKAFMFHEQEKLEQYNVYVEDLNHSIPEQGTDKSAEESTE